MCAEFDSSEDTNSSSGHLDWCDLASVGVCTLQDRRETRLKEEIEKNRAENPKITEQFADLKRKLSQVTESEWQAIPEIGDYSIKKKQRMQSFAPVPDTLLAAAAAEKQHGSSVMGSGTESTAGYATTDLTAVGEGRNTVQP